MGMFCGCLATLRPLFRKMFRLGSVGTSEGKPTGPINSPFPQNSRSAYGMISHHSQKGRDVEMGDLGTSSNAYKVSVNSANSNDMSSDKRASVSSESDSVEQILKDAKQYGVGSGNKGIVVSRQVNIARS